MTQFVKDLFKQKELNSRLDYVRLSRDGIPMKIFHKVLEYTSLSNKEIATMLPVSERQLTRYEDTHVLRKDISSHIIQLIELFEQGYEVFGKEKFGLWIRTENRVLDNMKPIDLMDTAIGINMISDIIGRIEHGVYS